MFVSCVFFMTLKNFLDEWMEPSRRLSASEVRRVLSFLRQQFRSGTLDLQNHTLPLLDDNTRIDIGEFSLAFLLKRHLQLTQDTQDTQDQEDKDDKADDADT
jgi:hypothetical protein